jgi:hypothetical protein
MGRQGTLKIIKENEYKTQGKTKICIMQFRAESFSFLKIVFISIQFLLTMLSAVVTANDGHHTRCSTDLESVRASS